MKTKNWTVVTCMLLFFLLCFSMNAFAQKLGYINSQQILAQYKEAQDAQEQLDKINKEWEAEGREMQTQFQELGQQLESQSLLLSEERQQEKQAELQALYQKIQQFQNEGRIGNCEITKDEPVGFDDVCLSVDFHFSPLAG